MTAWSLARDSLNQTGAPIGIFDSGHGGLTILRGLVDRLPRQSFIYLGDHANAPYGSRAPQEILALTQAGIEQLFAQGCRLVILACNTAAAVALRRLQQDWLPRAHPGRRILGVLVPMVEALARSNWYAALPDSATAQAGGMQRGETVSVFATTATVATGAYLNEVQNRAPWIRVVQRACPELAGLIERDAGDEVIGPLVAAHVAALLADLRHAAPALSFPDKAVLGCTHYPLIQHLFRAALPPQTEILSQPRRVAESLTAYLWRHPEFRRFEMEPATPRCFTTGDAALVSVLASRFFGGHLQFQTLPPG